MLIKDYHDFGTLQAINSYTTNKCKTFLELTRLSYKYDEVYASAATMGKSVGVARETFSRNSTQLQKDGLIEKYQRPGMPFDTCRYVITELGYRMLPRVKQVYNFLKYGMFSIGLLTSAPTPVVTLRTISGETISLKTTLTILPSYKQARETMKAPPNSILETNRESIVNEYFENSGHSWLTPAIENATATLNLTRWGQIRLSAYSPKAINYAIKAYENSKGSKQDRFKWFASVCWDYCRKNKLTPDWGLMNRLAIENEMPENPTLFVDAKPEQKAPDPERRTMKVENNQVAIETAKLRKRTQDRMALNLPEDIARERAYLLNNPEWLEIGRKLGADLSRWNLEEKVVTEIKDQIVCAQVDADDDRWHEATYIPLEESEWEEVR